MAARSADTSSPNWRLWSRRYCPNAPAADSWLEGCVDGHAIIGGFDTGWELARKLRIIDVDMQIGQNGPFGLHAGDPFERGFDIGVGGMRRIAQRIDDPGLDTFKCRESFFVQVTD